MCNGIAPPALRACHYLARRYGCHWIICRLLRCRHLQCVIPLFLLQPTADNGGAASNAEDKQRQSEDDEDVGANSEIHVLSAGAYCILFCNAKDKQWQREESRREYWREACKDPSKHQGRAALDEGGAQRILQCCSSCNVWDQLKLLTNNNEADL